MVTIEVYNIISNFIHTETGIIIPESNSKAVRRFLKNKMGENPNSAYSYLNKLKKDETEFHELIKIITISETYFFREEKYFKLLNDKILPEMKQKNIYPPISWSAAASTGEEAISLSLLINKFWNIPHPSYKPVIASDIDIHSMNKIKENKYTKNSIRDDGKSFHSLIHSCSKFDGERLSINDKILNSIEIKRLNLITDNYQTIFTERPQIIFLCNVLIYMEAKVREEIINKAVDVLAEGGYLFVSSSNTATINHDDLDFLQDGRSFYFKKRTKE